VRAAASEDSFAESNERAKRFDLLGPEGSISRYTPNDVSSLSTTTMKTMNSMTLSAVNLYRSDCKGVLHTSAPHDASNSDLAEYQMLTVSAADSYTRAARDKREFSYHFGVKGLSSCRPWHEVSSGNVTPSARNTLKPHTLSH
jgi:hypothetical protein